MPKIKTELLKEGMVVATDVKNMDQMLLLPAGCKLLEKHIMILQAWGIAEVQIEADSQTELSADPLAGFTPEALEQLKAEVRTRFWSLDENHPFQAAVFKLALHRQARKGSHA